MILELQIKKYRIFLKFEYFLEKDELLQWVYETDPTREICDGSNTYPFCPDGYYKFLLYSFVNYTNNQSEANVISASEAVRLFGSLTPIFGLNYTYLGDQATGCSLSSWTYLSNLFGSGLDLEDFDPENLWPISSKNFMNMSISNLSNFQEITIFFTSSVGFIRKNTRWHIFWIKRSLLHS